MTWSIRVENLSKLYRIGTQATFAQTISDRFLKRFKKNVPPPVNPTSTTDYVVSGAQMSDAPEGHFWALKDISFDIRQGERMGVIGQNGSGKSTLLKVLSRITQPTEGRFRYRGRLVSLLEVGTGFHVDLSGRENIFLNAAIYGMSHKAIRERFDDIVEFSEIGAQIDSPVKLYSSGMYMRLAFSVAAYLESEILIIDEVLAVGDTGFQKKCKEKMLEVAGEGRTLLFVSHDMNAINNICSKVLEFSHGKLTGPARDCPIKVEKDDETKDNKPSENSVEELPCEETASLLV